MAILVTSKYEDDPIKIEGARVATTQNKRFQRRLCLNIMVMYMYIAPG